MRRQQTGEYLPDLGVSDPTPSTDYLGDANEASSNKPIWIIGGLFVALLLVGGTYRASHVIVQRAFEAKVADQRAVVERVQAVAKQAELKHSPAIKQLATAKQAAKTASTELVAAKNKHTSLLATVDDLNKAAAVEVLGHSWTVNVDVEKCIAKPGEGWARPADAFDVRNEQRVHHQEKVLDRIDTLYRTETYRAQDGFTTETYTEKVSAGTRRVRSGTTTRSLGNGRFKRTPKYRTEKVYKNVTKTRQKPRMVTKTRQVPYEKKVYRDEPVKKPWYIYKTKQWTPAAHLTRSGKGREPLDPEGTPQKDAVNEVGAQRLRQRAVVYTLDLKHAIVGTKTLALKTDAANWNAIKDGASMFQYRSTLLTGENRDTRLLTNSRELASAAQSLARSETRYKQLTDKVPPLEQRIDPLENEIGALRSDAQVEKEKLSRLIRAGF